MFDFRNPVIKTVVFGAIGAALAYVATTAVSLPFGVEVDVIIGTIAAQLAHFFTRPAN